MCAMKNLTLRVEEDVLSEARQIAGEHSTSVNALVREFLTDLVKQKSRREAARKELSRLFKKSTAQIGDQTWKREDLYDR